MLGVVRRHPIYSALVVLGLVAGLYPQAAIPFIVCLMLAVMSGFPLAAGFRGALEDADIPAGDDLSSWDWFVTYARVIALAVDPSIQAHPTVGPYAVRYMARLWGIPLAFVAYLLGSAIAGASH